MEIRQLRHLLAAAECENYSLAAEKCSTSRQNIAHSIKVLESECDTTLFERDGGAMVLTPAGRKVVERAQGIIGKVDALSLMFSADDAEDPGLSIAVSTNLFDGMPPHTESFFTGLPGDMRFFEMDCERCYDAVRSGSADVAIVMCMQREFPGCDVFEVAGSAAYALVSCNSELAGARSVAAGDLTKYELAVMSDPEFQYAPLVGQLDALGYDRSHYGVISGTSAVLHMVKRGAVAFVSGVFASSAPEGVAAIPLSDPRLSWHFYMLFRPNARNFRAVMDFCASVRSAFAHDEREYGDMVRPSLIVARHADDVCFAHRK